MFDVICIGAATRDLFFLAPTLPISGKDHQSCLPLGEKIPVEKLIFSTGGGATNTATTFARFGWHTAICTSCGVDEAGSHIQEELEQNGITTTWVKQHPTLPTAHSAILTGDDGERTIFAYRGAANALQLSASTLKEMRARWFYITSLGGNIKLLRTLFKHAAAHGIQIAWNPGTEELQESWRTLLPFLKKTLVLILNDHEATWLTKETAFGNVLKTLSDLPPTSVVTCGKEGAYTTHKHATYHIKGSPIRAVSATGAGDAFGSGFVAAFDIAQDPVHALQVGALNSRSVVQKVGAKSGILPRFPSRAAALSLSVRRILSLT